MLSTDYGLRLEEGTSFRREQVRGVAESIRLVDTESGKPRTVYPGILFPKARSVLAELISRTETGCLFSSPYARHTHSDTFGDRLRKVVQELGLNQGITDNRF